MKLKLWRSLLLGLCLSNAIVYAALRSAPQVQAQISPDGTTNTNVNTTDSVINIERGDRAGDNLFHSFEEFSVPNGSEAFFNNANDIVNIFSRVTGGDISNIDGLIRANGDASLFLINPAGIIFGEGAALDLGGSFTASTADSIIFSDDVGFSATNADNPPLLTINQPIGLNYGNEPGSIAVNNSNLQVDSGDLALLGGDVTITGGQITAPGANVNVGGLSEAGQVSFEVIENGINFDSIDFPQAIAKGNITLTNGAEVNVQATGGGNIGINAGNLELSGGELGASSIIAGVASESRSPETQAGNVVIDATGDITIDRGSIIRNWVEESAVGNSGGIDIATANLSLTEGGQINANTSGLGNTGTIIIEADGTIEADGQGQDEFNSGIFNQVEESAVGNSGGIDITTTNLSLTQDAKVDASTLGQGDAGGINITTDNLSLTEGGQVNAISLFDRGNGGRITIKASDTIEADGEGPNGFSSGILSFVQGTEGNSGKIDITTTNLKLTRGAEVNASTLDGSQGDAGEIIIQASDIEADGLGQNLIGSGIFSLVDAVGTGNPSKIDITTTNLKLARGAEVNTSNFSGQTDAGEINIISDDLSLTEGGQINANTSDLGDGGAINIQANGTIEADGERLSVDGFVSSGIFSIVKQFSESNSGGINITTANLKLTRGAEINASTLAQGQGDAGEIVIQASDTVEADGRGQDEFSSGIFSVVDAVGTGNSGGIDITTTNLKLTGGAEVNASTFFGQRDAGGINIITDNLSLEDNAQISAESRGEGNAGNLSIQANTVALSNGASLFASTAVDTGGNITLQISDLLTLRDNSTISAEALENANGGNITIDADFVIAQPNQNNDIIASAAARGTGGNIDIKTNAIFGLEERSSTPPNNTNDLDASSEFGLDGTVEINELEANPTEALEELPVEIIDVTSLVEQNLCQQGQGSEFVVTGKGGTAPSPTQARDRSVSEVDLVKPVPFSEVAATVKAPAPERSSEIVEAQGWVVNDRGMVELVASKTDVDSSTAQPNIQVCHQQ